MAQPTTLSLALAGIANCTAALVTNPLDVVKVRMQVDTHARASGGGGGPPSMRATIAFILRSEGVRGLYRGLAPSLLREASYSSLRLGLYEPMRDALALVAGAPERGSSLGVKFAAGATSGVIGSAIANPADLLKVRLQAAGVGAAGGAAAPSPTLRLQAAGAGAAGGAAAPSPTPAAASPAGPPAHPPPPHRGLASMAAHIVATEGGVVALWRGVRPSMARAAVLTACQVATYDHIKAHLSAHLDEGLPLHAACAVAAGLVASAATTPIDVIKTRLMAGVGGSGAGRGGATGAPPPPSARAVVGALLAREGPSALYKGFLPTWMRIGPHTLTTFLVYERLRAAVGMKPV